MTVLPPFITAFLIAATILCGFLFIMFKRGNWVNLVFKGILFVMTIWGVLIIYDQRIIF